VWPSVFSVKMDIFALLVLVVVVFLLVYVCAFFFVDCDFGLAWAEKFGKPVGKLRTVIIVISHCNFCANRNVLMTGVFFPYFLFFFGVWKPEKKARFCVSSCYPIFFFGIN
jgi:hypothetical protein